MRAPNENIRGSQRKRFYGSLIVRELRSERPRSLKSLTQFHPLKRKRIALSDLVPNFSTFAILKNTYDEIKIPSVDQLGFFIKLKFTLKELKTIQKLIDQKLPYEKEDKTRVLIVLCNMIGIIIINI
jgi:hypothetical protein